MSRINDTYWRPVRHSAVGHQPVKLLAPHTGPMPLGPPAPQPSRRMRRAQAKGQLAAAKREARSGASWLRSLTTTSDPSA